MLKVKYGVSPYGDGLGHSPPSRSISLTFWGTAPPARCVEILQSDVKTLDYVTVRSILFAFFSFFQPMCDTDDSVQTVFHIKFVAVNTEGSLEMYSVGPHPLLINGVLTVLRHEPAPVSTAH